MPITPTHIAIDKATGTKKVLVEYDEATKKYNENLVVCLIESKWDIKPIIDADGRVE